MFYAMHSNIMHMHYVVCALVGSKMMRVHHYFVKIVFCDHLF